MRTIATQLGLFLCLALALKFSPGCATTDTRVTTLEQPAPLTQFGVDVENPYGGVRIEVTDRVDEVRITERLLTAPFASDATRAAMKQKIELIAERIENAPGFETLRVRVVALEPMKMEEGIDIVIRLRRCSGVRVRNSAGDVQLVGVDGAMQVETDGGDIEVRRDEPVRAPVALIATSGDVWLQTPGGDQGRVELVSDSGEAIFTSVKEPLHDMSSTGSHVRGVLGQGTNPITLRSDGGDVRYMIIDNPMTYTRALTGNRRLATPEKYRDEPGG